MKKSALSLINHALLLGHYLFVVQAHIDYNPKTPVLLQKERTDEIESMKTSLREDHFTINNIPIADDHTNPEVAKCLKDIENVLMEDTAIDTLGYINEYQGKDPTTFWMQGLQQSNTSDIFRDRVNHTNSPKSKRRRVVMSVPQEDHSQGLESIQTESHKDLIFGIHSEVNQIHPSASSWGPKLADISHHNRNYKQKKINDNVQCDAFSSETDYVSSSKFQHTKETPKNESEKAKHSASHSSGVHVVKFLKLKGAVALWYNPKVSNLIDRFFEQIEKNLCVKILSSPKAPYSQDQVNLAIEKIRTEIVMAYFGGLRMILQGDLRGISLGDLIADGWKYLQEYLYQQFHIGLKEISTLASISKSTQMHANHFSRPDFSLLQYVLKLEKDSRIHSSLITILVSNWEEQTIYHDDKIGLKFSKRSLLSRAKADVKLREKQYIWDSQHGKVENSNSTPNFSFSTPITQNISVDDMYDIPRDLIIRKPASYLADIGGLFLKDHQEFWNDVGIFFLSLEKEMISSLETSKSPISEYSNKSEGQNQMIMRPDMIQRAILKARFSVVPSFMGSLILFHQNQEINGIIEDLLRTGWVTLQAYFSAWGNLFSEDTSTIYLMPKQKPVHAVKWYNIKDPLHHLSLQKNYIPIPVAMVSFLCELWYDMMIQKSDIWGEGLGFEPSPPYRDLTNQIIHFAKHQRINFNKVHVG